MKGSQDIIWYRGLPQSLFDITERSLTIARWKNLALSLNYNVNLPRWKVSIALESFHRFPYFMPSRPMGSSLGFDNALRWVLTALRWVFNRSSLGFHKGPIHRFSQIVTGFHRFSQVFTGFHRFSQVFTDFHKFDRDALGNGRPKAYVRKTAFHHEFVLSPEIPKPREPQNPKPIAQKTRKKAHRGDTV